jgi:hypothetical protein
MAYVKHTKQGLTGMRFLFGSTIHIRWPDGIISLVKVLLQPTPNGGSIAGFQTDVHGLQCFVTLDEVSLWEADLPAKSNVTVLRDVKKG